VARSKGKERFERSAKDKASDRKGGAPEGSAREERQDRAEMKKGKGKPRSERKGGY